MLFGMGIAAIFYWLLALPLAVLVAWLIAALLALLGYVGFVYDGSLPPLDENDSPAPSSTSFRESIARALDVSIAVLPGTFYMVGLIFLSMEFLAI